MLSPNDSQSASESFKKTLDGFFVLTYAGFGFRATPVFSMAIKSAVVLNEEIGRRLLNVREAAQYLGLEVDTVYKKARLRELPCVKVGRALRFDLKALERFVEQHTIETID
ncbi:MAG TPA: helix-turn-helix domain-containing protein [Bryobacteraceae bacterium]|nr:helix-turn-helix domain-containing protein [Bryobacteraceae bacterium]